MFASRANQLSLANWPANLGGTRHDRSLHARVLCMCAAPALLNLIRGVVAVRVC